MSRRLMILLNLGSAIFGAFIGIFAQGFVLDKPSRVLAGAMAVVSMLALLQALRLSEDAARARSNEMADDEAMKVLGATLERLEDAGVATDALLRRQIESSGFHVVYLQTSTVTMDHNPVYDILKNLTSSIYVLDLYYEDARFDPSLGNDVLERSMSSMLDLAARGGTYERIVQHRNGDQAEFLAAIEGVFEKHYLECLEAKTPRVVTHIAPVTFPIKFWVADQRTVCLQVFRRTDTGSALEGELVLTDPTGRLASIFFELWKEVCNRGRPLRLE